MNLLELRNKYEISQKEAASVARVPLRTYIRYESDDFYGNELKRHAMVMALKDRFEVTEEKGILSIDKIKQAVTLLFDTSYKEKVEFCYLFGSYAKGQAKEESDVDLYVVSSLTGFAFTGLMEQLRTSLNKKVDVIRPSELRENIDLTNEIMKWGIKIYGK